MRRLRSGVVLGPAPASWRGWSWATVGLCLDEEDEERKMELEAMQRMVVPAISRWAKAQTHKRPFANAQTPVDKCP